MKWVSVIRHLLCCKCTMKYCKIQKYFIDQQIRKYNYIYARILYFISLYNYIKGNPLAIGYPILIHCNCFDVIW